jgi:Fe-S oxidoreductase
VHGYLGAFEKTARRTAAIIDRLAEAGVPLVGIDPSMTLAFRSEYSGTGMKARVLLPQEWLATVLDRLPSPAVGERKRVQLMAHCTERTNAPVATAQWKAVFAKLGMELVEGEVGCCGMAGTFGHEVRNRALSETLYAMSWQPALATPDRAELVMATGYSCRSQVKLMDGVRLPHPFQAIRATLQGNSTVPFVRDATYDM